MAYAIYAHDATRYGPSPHGVVGTVAAVVCTLQRRTVFSHASVVAGAPVWALAHLALAYAQGTKTSTGPVAYLGLKTQAK